jgi:Zn-dependent protease
MTPPEIVLKLIQFAILLFALSLHEASHAWMASRLGDQTARMLGRVTLNPIKHIDPIGTLLFPLIAMFSGVPLLGWAKPTPVTARNFQNYKRDDILVTLAGPVSNLLAAFASVVLLVILAKTSQVGNDVVHQVASGQIDIFQSTIMLPIVLFCYFGIIINLFLTVFNLLPLPPLDGSHIFRYMLPYSWTALYDRLGIISLFLMFFFGGRVVMMVVSPVLYAIRSMLFSL